MSTTDVADIMIEIRENGPYIVKGLKRFIGPDGREIETKESLALCRCGGSQNKPFCDGTHKSNGFSGHREIFKPLRRSREYEGKEVTIRDNRTICAHAAYCTEELSAVFKRDERPWIDPDGASKEEIAELVHRCPSGALAATINGERIDRIDRVGEITIRSGGPYEVRGGIVPDIADDLTPPEPTRYALCRCGASKNKPYCDGSHHDLPEGWDRD